MEIIKEPVTKKDLIELILRARASKQSALEGVLTTTLACLQGNQLEELQGKYREFSLEKIAEYEKRTGTKLILG